MATLHATLTQLAHQAATQIGFTVRRRWRDKTDPSVLRVEVGFIPTKVRKLS
jgi:hypothetical protein